jgi:DNA-binding FadR family transcriptional regulator
LRASAGSYFAVKFGLPYHSVPGHEKMISTRIDGSELGCNMSDERATLDERAKMLQFANAVVDAAKIGDGSLYLRVVRELNTLLCESARNEFLYKLMISIYALSRQFAFVHNQRVETRQRAGTYHAGILRAVAAQDQKAALKASDAMIGYLREYARNVERESAAAPRRRAKTASRSAR